MIDPALPTETPEQIAKMEAVANSLKDWINTQPIVKDPQTGDPSIAPVYGAHVLLCELIRHCVALTLRLQQAEQERDTLKEIVGNPAKWMRWCDHKVLERCETAEAEVARLRTALQEYGQHKSNCSTRDCANCGYSASMHSYDEDFDGVTCLYEDRYFTPKPDCTCGFLAPDPQETP